MDELRWILTAIGIAVIGAVYWFGDPERQAKRQASKEKKRRENEDDVGLEDELKRLSDAIAKDRDQILDGQLEQSTEKSGTMPEEPPESIVVLYVKAHDDARLRGPAIVKAARDVGLELGPTHVFHRYHEIDDERIAVFTVANIVQPGEFPPDQIQMLETPGLCLFLTLPNPLSALDAWDAMLAAGRRLADLLEADVQDDSRSSLSRQRIAHIRDQMREYDRKKGLNW